VGRRVAGADNPERGAEMAEERGKRKSFEEYLAHDVETIWRTLKFNSETIKLLDEPSAGEEETRMRPSTDGCSDHSICTPCSGNGCVMTVYH
jgi:hypothetical protein